MTTRVRIVHTEPFSSWTLRLFSRDTAQGDASPRLEAVVPPGKSAELYLHDTKSITIEERPAEESERQTPKDEEPEWLAQFFVFAHLPLPMQEVSRPFSELALAMMAHLPRNPERTVALRKLLEAKDCAVRALIGRSPTKPAPAPPIPNLDDAALDEPITSVEPKGTVS